MKTLLTLLSLTAFCSGFSQTKLDTRPLLYKTLIPGKVVMKSGTTETADFNYNTNNQSLVFFNGKEILELTGHENIREVVLDKLVFIPMAGKFYETTSTPDLFISYSNKRIPKNSTVEKGGVVNVESAASSNDVSDAMLLKRYRNSDGLKYVRSFWWRQEGKLKPMNSISEIAKALGATKEAVGSLVKTNDININELTGIEKIINHKGKGL